MNTIDESATELGKYEPVLKLSRAGTICHNIDLTAAILGKLKHREGSADIDIIGLNYLFQSFRTHRRYPLHAAGKEY